VALASNFYPAVFGMAGSGLFMAMQTGLPGIVFLGHGAAADFWAYPVRTVHYVLSRLLMALIALHIAGALYHTFVRKDGCCDNVVWPARTRPSAVGRRQETDFRSLVMNHLMPAQAGAQLVSLVVFASIARWYVAPWLTSRAAPMPSSRCSGSTYSDM